MSQGPALLKAWRGERSQADVAKLLGVNQGTISRLESGESEPGASMAVRLETVSDGFVPVASWASPADKTGETAAVTDKSA